MAAQYMLLVFVFLMTLAAIKDAQAKASEKAQEEMGKLTEGLGLPPGMKLPV